MPEWNKLSVHFRKHIFFNNVIPLKLKRKLPFSRTIITEIQRYHHRSTTWWEISFAITSTSSQILFFLTCKWLHLKSIHFLSQHGWASLNNKPLLAAYLVCTAGPQSVPAKDRWTRGSLGDGREVGLGMGLGLGDRALREDVWHRTNQGGGGEHVQHPSRRPTLDLGLLMPACVHLLSSADQIQSYAECNLKWELLEL